MSNISVKFLGKKYSIPEDILTYIDLLDFTDNIKNQLVSAFVRKLRNEIAKDNIGLLGDEDLSSEIERQVGKFIAKLCDNGIFTRTISDYLTNNRGYQLISDVNKAALDKMKSLLMQEMDAWQAGYEQAVNKAESHVTGMGFSIWSSSFVHHAIYAAMEASTLNKQGKEAEAQYQKDMADLHSRLDSQYGGEKSTYINNTYIPNMEAALTVFAYELLDAYVADLIANGMFDGKALDFVDISRSNDLLRNLSLSNNKKTILGNAFAACPYNIAVYMQAIRYDLLDYDSFLAAKEFKQSDKILAFLKESIGVADYPKYVQPNIHSATLLSRVTSKSLDEVLHQHTLSYANAVVNEYAKIIEALGCPDRCRKFLSELSEDEILSGENTSMRLANALVRKIVPNSTWESLAKQCGHKDLFDRLLRLLPNENGIDSKAKYDDFLTNALCTALEKVRSDLEHEIIEKRAHVEAERQKEEELKRKKYIIISAACGIIIILLIFLVSLPSCIKNRNIANREHYIDAEIQNIILPFEKEIESKIDNDVYIDYSYSLENDWDSEQWYEWTFSIRLPMLEDYRKSGSNNNKTLLEIMDDCKIINDIYDDVYDDLDLDLRYEGIRIVVDFQAGNMGALKIQDLSTDEIFYYEEYSGNRYLHSFDTEYVIDADLQYEDEIDSTEAGYDKHQTWYNVEFASSFLGKELDADGTLSMGPGDYEVISNDMYLFDIPGRFSHGMSSSDTNPVIVDILDWVTTEDVDDINDIINHLIERYGNDYRVQHYDDASGDAYMWKDVEIYEYVICWQNADGTVDIRWTYPISKESDANNSN